jgi:hypothetical protein
MIPPKPIVVVKNEKINTSAKEGIASVDGASLVLPVPTRVVNSSTVNAAIKRLEETSPGLGLIDRIFTPSTLSMQASPSDVPLSSIFINVC